MTKTQLLKALAAAKIETVEISGRGRGLEVTVKDERTMRRFAKQIAPWGGYRTGWGGWVLQATSAPVDRHDFNSTASRHHY
jgi:hypothetical protein